MANWTPESYNFSCLVLFKVILNSEFEDDAASTGILASGSTLRPGKDKQHLISDLSYLLNQNENVLK